tara:strand:- start:119 stop:1510 length:1392 start_codon:yes stop_codon:yes gene_type:complete
MRHSKKFFFTTRKLTGPYRFIIEAAKKHSEEFTNERLSIIVNQNYRIDIISIFYVIKFFFETNFFSKKKIMLVNYHGYNLGRYTIPEIHKNYNVYSNKFLFICESLKCFYINLNILRSIIKLEKNNIKAAFIDHCMYKNGLIFSVLSRKKIPIYTTGYPKGIIYFINNKKKILNYEDIIQLKKTKKLNKKQIKDAKSSIKKIIQKPDIIPWMKSIKFVKENKKFDKITHLIYAHSFTDGQMLYGYDGFINVYDWLEFTIDELAKNNNNKIIIKAHPFFFDAKFPNIMMKYDRKLFFRMMLKYKKNKNLIFLKEPIKNGDLLKKLNKKKIILISHHGSAILEGLFLNFKCIASKATFWSSKFQLTNHWDDKLTYKKILKKNWDHLNNCKMIDVYNICYQVFCNPLSLYGKHFWQEILSRELKIPRQKIYQESVDILDKVNLDSKKLKKLIQKISKSIECVKIGN